MWGTGAHVTRHTSHITRHTSHITRCMSKITCHMSHVTHNKLFVKRHYFFQFHMLHAARRNSPAAEKDGLLTYSANVLS